MRATRQTSAFVCSTHHNSYRSLSISLPLFDPPPPSPLCSLHHLFRILFIFYSSHFSFSRRPSFGPPLLVAFDLSVFNMTESCGGPDPFQLGDMGVRVRGKMKDGSPNLLRVRSVPTGISIPGCNLMSGHRKHAQAYNPMFITVLPESNYSQNRSAQVAQLQEKNPPVTDHEWLETHAVKTQIRGESLGFCEPASASPTREFISGL